GVVDQECQLLVHGFVDAGVQYSDQQAEGAGHASGYFLPRFQHLDQVAQRLDHATQGADGALVCVDEVGGSDGGALGAFRPGLRPAINGERPGEIGQQLDGAGVRVPEFAQGNRYALDLCQSLGRVALQLGGVAGQQAGGHSATVT